MKIGVQQRLQNFARPIGSEIAHQYAVTVLHARIAVQRDRFDEFVGDPRGIACPDCGNRIGCRGAVCRYDEVIGLLHPVPALVPVHCEKTAAHGGKRDTGDGFYLPGEFRDKPGGAFRRGIPSIEKHMYGDRNTRIGHNFRQFHQMILV